MTYEETNVGQTIGRLLSEHPDLDPLADGALDVGPGFGGPARQIGRRAGGRVTGIDITPAYVDAARDLTARTGLRDLVDFRVARSPSRILASQRPNPRATASRATSSISATSAPRVPIGQPPRSATWPAREPASSTARSWTLTAAATRLERSRAGRQALAQSAQSGRHDPRHLPLASPFPECQGGGPAVLMRRLNWKAAASQR
jgi:hypothetical protein